MGTLDGPIRSVAGKLMAKFGTTVTIRSVTGGAYNTTTGVAAETTSDTVVKGMLEEYTAHERGESVKVGDRKLTIAAEDLTFAPDTEDRVLISAVIYRVVNVVTVMATDQAALYILQIRGAA